LEIAIADPAAGPVLPALPVIDESTNTMILVVMIPPTMIPPTMIPPTMIPPTMMMMEEERRHLLIKSANAARMERRVRVILLFLPKK